MLTLRIILAVTAIAFAGAARGGVNEWTLTGAEGGYARAIAFDPAAPGTVLAGAGWSIYRSTDLGQTWTEVAAELLSGVQAIVFDPASPQRVMAATLDGLFRSDDGGMTFAPTTAPPWIVMRLTMAPDGSTLYAVGFDKISRTTSFGAQWIDASAGLPGNIVIGDVVVDPHVPGTVYAVLQVENAIYRSNDAGASWSLFASFPGAGLKRLAIDPANSTHMLLATHMGVRESRDGGATWDDARLGQFAWVGYTPSTNGAAIAIPFHGPVLRRLDRDQSWVEGHDSQIVLFFDAKFDPFDTDADSTLFVATSDQPQLTQDGGMTFMTRAAGLRGAGVSALVAVNDAEGTVYALYGEGPVGLHRRTLAGWVAADRTALLGKPWGDRTALAVAPDDPNFLFLAGGHNVLHTENGGQTWTSHPQIGGVTRSIAFDPFDPNLIYAATDQGFYWSSNRGQTWFPRMAGLPANPIELGAIAVDPTTSGTVYAARSSIQAAPALFKSTNRGADWAPASDGLDSIAIQTIAVHPQNSAVVYAGGLGPSAGLFKSVDAAQSWQRVGNPIGTSSQPLSMLVDPAVPTTLIMTTGSTASPARSVDGGATWEALGQVGPGRYGLLVSSVVLDPLRPANVIGTVRPHGLVELEIAPDLEATVPSVPVALPLGAGAPVTVRVANRGPFAASAVHVSIELPAGTSADAPTPPQGSCSATPGGFDCALGPLHVDQSLDTPLLVVGGDTPMAGTLSASVSAHEADVAVQNNSVSVPIATDAVADLGVTLVPSATSVTLQSPVTLTATAVNDGPNAAADVQLVIDLGVALSHQSATASRGTCTALGNLVTCVLGTLAAAEQATIAVTALGNGVGTLTPAATISAATLDAVAANDSAAASLTGVTPPAAPPSRGGGGGGGGGAGGLVELVALFALAVCARGVAVCGAGRLDRRSNVPARRTAAARA